MGLKNVLCIICIFIATAASAQDRIFKKNGEIIEARVTSVGNSYVVFKRARHPEGREYSIYKGDVAKIRYSDGMEDIFENNYGPSEPLRSRGYNGSSSMGYRNDVCFSRNIVSAAPLIVNENGFGFAIAYERFLDNTGWVSFNLPFVSTFRPVQLSTGYRRTDPMVYLTPGIKIYTDMNSCRRGKFSIGPSLVIGAGSKTKQEYSPYYGGYYSESRFVMGAMLNGGFNFFPTPYLYLGGEGGLGAAYVNQYDGYNKGMSVLAQLSFKIGYMF
jgi:hypothetical protein